MAGFLGRLRNRWAAIVHDLLMVPVAWLGAYWLRFNLEQIPADLLRGALAALPVVLAVQAAVFWYFGLYRGIWRFASMPDLIRILRAVGAGMLLVAIALFLARRMEGVPRSVPPLYAGLLLVLLGGPRFLYRAARDRGFAVSDSRPVLIVGAGSAGELLVRDLLRDPQRRYRPLAFVDDDPRTQGKEVQGVRVRGRTQRLPELARGLGAELVLLALPSASAAQMRRVVDICEQAGLPFRTLPRLQDLVSGQVSLNTLREVCIEDLLGREPVSLDWRSIRAGVAGKTVLVTGGGGSIGAELCRQIARLGPMSLVVLDQGEYNLYAIEMELRRAFPALELQARLGDVCDPAAVRQVLSFARPHLVFHAAAYKHVPLLEHQAREATRNNVLGTRNVALAAAQQGCEAFVLISTDKAVNPTSVMGASKRVAEILCQNLGHHAGTRFITVRFGNVLDSAGSVVPLFRQQIAAGGPVTVTHPEVRRYFMTIPEAAQLILQAAVLGSGGEIFVLDMGEPVTIRYLAEQMIRLSGRVPGEDVRIVYTGLRPGEKLYEELFHPEEPLATTGHEQILLARYREVDEAVLDAALQRLEGACARYDDAAVREVLAALVPELRGCEKIG
jgi:FlaA1/EpsC-like NDP-sugar epimerase